MNFNKPPLSIQDQLNHLSSRGLTIDNAEKTKHYLAYMSYYRLKAYMLPFQIPGDKNHAFKSNTHFKDVLNLYFFDRELRLLVLDAIERIEIAIRAQIINEFSIPYGSHWFENPAYFKNTQFHQSFLSNLDNEIRRTNEIFIKHYITKYSRPPRPPSWMSLEIVSFSSLSMFYNNIMTLQEKKNVAKNLKISHYTILESWLHCLSYLRNICAHHGRLWNRVLTIQPVLLSNPVRKWIKDNNFPINKLYSGLCCINYLLGTVNQDSSMGVKLIKLFNKFPQVDSRQMGFPDNWFKDSFWEIPKISFTRLKYHFSKK